MAVLISFAGLPGTGKSSIARELAIKTGAIWLRIDSIEQAIRKPGLATQSMGDAGYRAAYAVAEDNLRVGRDIIADAVNDCMLARNGWRDVSLRSGAGFVEVETICADIYEHRRRVETRVAEIPGLILPDWHAVISRAYEPWDRQHLKIDTAGRGVDECVAIILATLIEQA